MANLEAVRWVYRAATVAVFPALAVLGARNAVRIGRIRVWCPADPSRLGFFVRALVHVEDRRFWAHRGVDFLSMLRAVRNMLRGDGLQSGSTLTQQLVKNACWGVVDAPRTMRRKIPEMVAAIVLEQRLSKEQILALYVNGVYWGPWQGLARASVGYFKRRADRLTPHEAVALVTALCHPAFVMSRKGWWAKLQLQACRELGIEEKALLPDVDLWKVGWGRRWLSCEVSGPGAARRR